MLKRFVLDGFPGYLIIIEWAVRFLLQYVQAGTRIAALSAASVAAVGLGLRCPLVVQKPVAIPQALVGKIPEGCVIASKWDRRISDLSLIMLLVLGGAWGYCLYLGHLSQEPSVGNFSESWIIGIAIYLVAVFLTEIKEAL